MSCSGLLKSDDVKRAGGSLKALVTHKLQTSHGRLQFMSHKCVAAL